MKFSLSRILVGLLAAAGLVGASVNAQAATATGNFNVNVTLTSKCEINGTAAATGAVITDIALAYTSFQTSAATGSTSFNVRCTNSLPYTLALDLTTVTDQALNLDYVLGLSNSPTVPTSGLSALYPTAGTLNGNQTIYLQGRAAAGQAGNASCVSPCVTSRPYTVTITYN